MLGSGGGGWRSSNQGLSAFFWKDSEINAFVGNNEQELLLYILRVNSDVYRGEEGNKERQNAAF